MKLKHGRVYKLRDPRHDAVYGLYAGVNHAGVPVVVQTSEHFHFLGFSYPADVGKDNFDTNAVHDLVDVDQIVRPAIGDVMVKGEREFSVLGVNGETVRLSKPGEPKHKGEAMTIYELREFGYHLKREGETVTIDGKPYDKDYVLQQLALQEEK